MRTNYVNWDKVFVSVKITASMLNCFSVPVVTIAVGSSDHSADLMWLLQGELLVVKYEEEKSFRHALRGSHWFEVLRTFFLLAMAYVNEWL